LVAVHAKETDEQYAYRHKASAEVSFLNVSADAGEAPYMGRQIKNEQHSH